MELEIVKSVLMKQKMGNGSNLMNIESIGTFREWLREKEKELEEFREFASLNEIFEIITDYKKVTSTEYVNYRIKNLEKNDAYYLTQCGSIEDKCKREHGPRVHYYMYKNYLIYYGKFKYSNKFEIHFLDTTNSDANIMNGKNNYSTIFSAIMSILKDKHFDKNKYDDIYIVNNNAKKINFYEVLIKNILKKYKISDWFVLKDRRGLVISKNDKIITERDDLVAKTLLSQEDKELLDRLDENNGYV